MSKALKCDRCHNYYDPYKSTYLIMGPNMAGVDLCPACRDKLTKWLKEYEFFESVCEEEKDGQITERTK